MQTIYLMAGVLAILTGIAHSVLGEILIFRHLRENGVVPSRPAPPLRERHVRIIWASWHLVSVFGWAFAGILLAIASGADDLRTIAVNAIVASHLGGSALVLVGTRGRHPGWIALLAVAALVRFA